LAELRLWRDINILAMLVLAGCPCSAGAQPAGNGVGGIPAPLQGGIKQGAPLRPALIYDKGGLSGSASSAKPFSLDANVDQFKGGGHLGGSSFNVEQIAPRTPIVMPTRRGVIPPISSYRLMPGASTVWYAPGTAAPVELRPADSASSYAARAGVNEPGYSLTAVQGRRGFSVDRTDWLTLVPLGRAGVTCWSSEYAVFYNSVQTARSWQNVWSLTSAVAGKTTDAEVEVVRPQVAKEGVIAWAPGYEISVKRDTWSKETLGGAWSAPADVTPLLATAKRIALTDRPLQGKGFLSGSMLNANAGLLSADQWYERVSQTIYARWKNADVGPGQANMHVTVMRDGRISGYISEFVSLTEQHDLSAEAAFKDAALRAVDSVYPNELPPFPTSFSQSRIEFDMQLKRTVDGPGGVEAATSKL
jgi:hypothetical protein